MLSANKFMQPMKFVVKAIAQMCDGEIVQAANKFNLNQSIEDYYQRIYKKTGILIAACCQAGAVIGGGDEGQRKALERYGINIGYAFQIIDDILDFTGTKEMLGKPVASDLKDGNITLPILKLIQQKEYKIWIEKMFQEEGVTSHHYDEILRVLKDSYALEDAYREAVVCVEHAKKALTQVQDSDYKRLLLHIGDEILTRKN
jgi:heptaprenyl diphosphate synthase